MKKFSVPATYTISGWVTVEAESMDEAMEVAHKMNQAGVEMYHIEDTSTSSELMVDEIEEVV